MYCSKKCSTAYQSKTSSIRMAETNRKYASERMKKNNPMKNRESREKMSRTLKLIGHKPKIQGGNGRGLTEPQRKIIQSLRVKGICCVAEHAIPTKKQKGTGYPYCYKVDIAILSKKVAIEIDGRSHGLIQRQVIDLKKDALLKSLGWTVLRFTNQKVNSDVAGCVKAIKEALT